MFVGKIDTHVHFRDGKEAYKQTIRGSSEEAVAQGITAVGDMPNTNPPILWEEDVIKRLELAEAEKPLVQYFLWVGLTSEEDQIKEAVRIVREIPQVVGLKLYAGPTTGSLNVAQEEEQKKVYRTLSILNFQGVLAVHCEKSSELRPDLWNPGEPWTHEQARPLSAEIKAVEDQINFAQIFGFRGNLHICHASCSETIDLVSRARMEGLNTSCEITPHHLLLTERETRKPIGSRFKVNPPLRNAKVVRDLQRNFLKRRSVGWIWIATDYAPHTLEEKLKRDAPSGIADYLLYCKLLNWLEGKGSSRLQLERLTSRNIIEAFGGKF